MALFRKKPTGPTVESLLGADGHWLVAEGELEGHPMLVRLRTDLDDAVDRQDWPVRIGIAIPITAPSETGLPSGEENGALDVIEDTVATVSGDRAILAIVITTSGMREFVLHSQTSDWIAEFHAELRQAVTTHEVQMVSESDEDWVVYNSFWS